MSPDKILIVQINHAATCERPRGYTLLYVAGPPHHIFGLGSEL